MNEHFCPDNKHQFGLIEGGFAGKAYIKGAYGWYLNNIYCYYQECLRCHFTMAINATPIFLDENDMEIGFSGNRPINSLE